MIRSRWQSLRSEDGVAIIVALLVMLVVGVFAATIATGSVSLSRSANDDRDSKRALAAAEAGMRRMVYLLNTRGEDLCLPTDLSTGDLTVPVGDSTVTISGGAAYDCAKPEFVNQSLGSGITYSTYMSPILAVSAGPAELQLTSCVGLPIDDLSLTGGDITRTIPINQRCITSIGKSNNVTRRIEARVAALIASQLFKVGLTGRERTCIAGPSAGCPTINGAGGGQGQAQIFSDIGSNVLIDTGPIETCGNRLIAPGGQVLNGGNCTTVPYPGANFPTGLPTKSTYTCTTAGGCPPGTIESNPQPPPDVVGFFQDYSKTRCINITTAGCTGGIAVPPGLPVGSVASGDTRTVNDNGRLAEVIAGDSTCSTSGANRAGYDAATRVLDLSGCKNILLPAGTYNLCRVTNMASGLTLGAASTASLAGPPASAATPAIVMLDGHRRLASDGTDASDCGATHNFEMNNNSNLSVPTLPSPPFGAGVPDSLALQFFAMGNPNCAGWQSTTICTNAPEVPHRLSLRNAGANASVGIGVFAPNSQLEIGNSGNSKQTLTGAFYARWLDISNGFEFREDPRYSTQQFPPTVKQYARTTWRECPPGGFTGTVRSGC